MKISLIPGLIICNDVIIKYRRLNISVSERWCLWSPSWWIVHSSLAHKDNVYLWSACNCIAWFRASALEPLLLGPKELNSLYRRQLTWTSGALIYEIAKLRGLTWHGIVKIKWIVNLEQGLPWRSCLILCRYCMGIISGRNLYLMKRTSYEV